nr:MAG TPA: hypothetical protein [Caudoviricetes sp.]
MFDWRLNTVTTRHTRFNPRRLHPLTWTQSHQTSER